MKFSSCTGLDDVSHLIQMDPLTFSVRKVVDVQFFEEKVSDLSVFLSKNTEDISNCIIVQ